MNTPRLPDPESHQALMWLIEQNRLLHGKVIVRPVFPMPEWIFLDKAQK